MPRAVSAVRKHHEAAIAALALVVLWELAVRGLGLPQYIIPTPSSIVVEIWNSRARIAANGLITSFVVFTGFVIAIVVSIPLAWIISSSRFLERTIYPTLVFLQIVPKIALAPLFIIWFGFGLLPKLLIVFLLSFFPILVSSIAGFKSIEPNIIDLARSTGARGWIVFRRIRLPYALPSIFTGLKVGAAISATAGIVAEFVASDSGLGYLLLEYNGNLETTKVFAAIVVLSLIGILLYYLVELIERLTIPWHQSQARDPDRILGT